jgi:hypothetical protein
MIAARGVAIGILRANKDTRAVTTMMMTKITDKNDRAGPSRATAVRYPWGVKWVVIVGGCFGSKVAWL